MKCPTCNAWSLVKETRTQQSGNKTRRYECANLHRFSTTESHGNTWTRPSVSKGKAVFDRVDVVDTVYSTLVSIAASQDKTVPWSREHRGSDEKHIKCFNRAVSLGWIIKNRGKDGRTIVSLSAGPALLDVLKGKTNERIDGEKVTSQGQD